MRFFAVSIISLFVALPAFAAARLPVVNVASGGVSARAAFGDVQQKTNTNDAKKLYGNIAENAPTVTVAPVARPVVARSAQPVSQSVAKTNIAHATSTDVGGPIAAGGEVLTPHRPSSDLWAQNDTPLRMPSPSEFSVIRSDAMLPEENLDGGTRVASVAQRDLTPRSVQAVKSASQKPMSEIDAQIARLNELQQRANASLLNQAPVKSEKESVGTSAKFVASNDVDMPQNKPDTAKRAVVGRVPVSPKNIEPTKPAVKLSRLVVPMDEDVVVRSVKKTESPTIASVRQDMTKLSPTELRKAFRKTFLSENKHLSTYQMDDRFDVASDMSASMEGFTARHDLSEEGGIRPLEIKIKFRNDDSALSRDNFNLLTEYAGVVLNNPMRAIQVGIPQNATTNTTSRKLAARRLAIVEQVLRDSGISEQRIMPVLSTRNDDSFVLRIISADQYETLTQQQKNIFGDTVKNKTYKSMAW